jgi:hypothetical protein
MLSVIYKRYIVFGTFLYAFIASLFPIEMQALYVANYLSLLIFTLFINYLDGKPEAYFTEKKMFVLVFYYSFFVVFCYNLISYFYNGNFYIFSESDALLYHDEAEVMSNMPFIKGIEYYLSRHEVEDLGIVIVLSTLYNLGASKLLLSAAYVFAAVITAWGMFHISKRFMPYKYACLCAITYCLSSYVLWFHSSGLKESLLVMLIVLFYSSYYNVVIDKKAVSVWGVIIAPLALLLFRPVLSAFCLLSIAIGMVLNRKLSVPQIIFLLIVMLAGIYFLEPLLGSTDKFLLGGTESMLEIKEMEGMVKGNIPFTYLVNTISSMFGPFPSLLSSKTHLTFYAPGLIFKIFISIAFWFGLMYVIKHKISKTYPMLGFIFLEMGSLTYILEALELRKSIPHFPLVYIIAFLFMYKYDSRQLISAKNYVFYKKSFNLASVVLCLLMIYWNFR